MISLGGKDRGRDASLTFLAVVKTEKKVGRKQGRGERKGYLANVYLRNCAVKAARGGEEVKRIAGNDGISDNT